MTRCTAARRASKFLGELEVDAYGANALVRSAVERQLDTVRRDLPGLRVSLEAELARFPRP